MKTGIIVLCRYNSSRLPGKILKTIQGKAVLQYIMERLQCTVPEGNIVVATSVEPSDNPIAEYCSAKGWNCFRGDLDNVSQRFLGCALKYEMEYAVRINGDNLFLDPELLSSMLAIVEGDRFDFITNVKDRTFPIGMSIEIVRTPFYKSLIERFAEDAYLEHVTLYLYDHPKIGRRQYVYNERCPEAKGLKLAVDEAKDFDLASKIIGKMNKLHAFYGIKEIYHLITSLNE